MKSSSYTVLCFSIIAVCIALVILNAKVSKWATRTQQLEEWMKAHHTEELKSKWRWPDTTKYNLSPDTAAGDIIIMPGESKTFTYTLPIGAIPNNKTKWKPRSEGRSLGLPVKEIADPWRYDHEYIDADTSDKIDFFFVDTLPKVGICVITAIQIDSIQEFVIADEIGVMAQRIGGKWTITDCKRALEAWYKIDSTRLANISKP